MAASPASSGGTAPGEAPADGAQFAFGEYILDSRTRRLLRDTSVVPLTAKAFDTLEVLVRAAGRTVSKDDILKRVWPGTFVQEDTLAQNISTIRRALGETADAPRHLLTVPRDGYRFVAPVEIVKPDRVGTDSVPRQEQPTTPRPVTDARPVGVRRWLFALAAGLALGAALAAFALRKGDTPSSLPIAFDVFEPEGTHFSSSGGLLALSPDGRHLAFIATGPDGQDHLWIRSSGSRESTPVPGAQDASQPFWSADSGSIAFFSQGALRRFDISDGQVRTVCQLASNANALAGSWSSRDVIAFAVQGTGLFQVRASGGTPTRMELTGMHECSACVWPSFLPDGEHFLFTVASGGTDGGIYLGSLDGAPPHRVIDEASSAAYTTDGYLLYAAAGTLVARRFDPVSGQAGGDPIAIADRISLNPFTRRAVFSASNVGLIAYAEPMKTRLQWISRAGDVISAGPEGVFHSLATSRTGRTLVSQLDSRLGTYDLWLYDADWSNAARVTFDPGSDLTPVWSEDGSRAVFARELAGKGWQLYEINVDRPGTERPLLPTPWPRLVRPMSWRNNLLYYGSAQAGEDGRIWVIRTDNPGPPTLAASVPRSAAIGQGLIAPNGRWLAYARNVIDSRVPRGAVLVTPWPTAPGQVQVVSEGSHPRWSGDSRELFFLVPDGHLMAAPMRDDGEIGAPVPLCQTRALEASGVAGDPYDASFDGRRFLVKVPAQRPSIVMLSRTLPGGTP